MTGMQSSAELSFFHFSFFFHSINPKILLHTNLFGAVLTVSIDFELLNFLLKVCFRGHLAEPSESSGKGGWKWKK